MDISQGIFCFAGNIFSRHKMASKKFRKSSFLFSTKLEQFDHFSWKIAFQQWSIRLNAKDIVIYPKWVFSISLYAVRIIQQVHNRYITRACLIQIKLKPSFRFFMPTFECRLIITSDMYVLIILHYRLFLLHATYLAK